MLIMNRKAFSGIIVLTMLLTCMLTLAFNIQPVKAGTIIVPDDYPTIQEAIDAASPRDTIFVKAGTYYEHVSINKSISLIGEDRNLTVIDGSGTGNVVTVTASNVIINNFTIQRSGSGGWSAGIRVNSIGNCNITRNKIENNNFGIYLYESSNNTISENDITANFCGVRLYLSSHNTLSKNNVTAITANDFYGIYLDRSSNNTLIGNTITKNSEVGIWLDYSSYNVLTGNQMSDNGKNFAVDGGYINYVDDSNTVNGKPIYYCISKKDKAIPFDAGCVILVYCEGIKVQNLMLTGNTRGIQLIYTKNSTITKNNITSCHDGISLDRSSNYNNITENNIISNRNGLFISYLSKYNVISKNRITGNHKGIIFSESSDNKIYHNNFIDNAEQAYSYASPNIWDDGYPSGGNYWSDYNGTDLYIGPYQNEIGSDGIGDNWYEIDENNTDHYPLMGMFSDFNATSECHVQTICNSTISDFQYNGTVMCFIVSGENGTAGFCRICVPTALMNENYKVFVNGTEVPHTLLPCSNSTHSYLYFTYEHSTQEVVIIPELPSTMLLPFLMISTLVAFVLRKKRRIKQQKRGG